MTFSGWFETDCGIEVFSVAGRSEYEASMAMWDFFDNDAIDVPREVSCDNGYGDVTKFLDFYDGMSKQIIV